MEEAAGRTDTMKRLLLFTLFLAVMLSVGWYMFWQTSYASTVFHGVSQTSQGTSASIGIGTGVTISVTRLGLPVYVEGLGNVWGLHMLFFLVVWLVPALTLFLSSLWEVNRF